MPKYWGSSPKVGQKQQTEKKEKKNARKSAFLRKKVKITEFLKFCFAYIF